MSKTRVQLPFVPCPFLTGEWQDYVDRLFSIHCELHGCTYQRIPDRVRGDRGLEGFTNRGDAVQAYADAESRTLDERRNGQRRKIRQDLKKLETHADWWTNTLQGEQLHTWRLLVPFLDDANVIQYARTCAQKLLQKNLPFIADDFQALVHTAADYPRALALVDNPSQSYRIIRLRPANDGDLTSFTQREPRFVPNIERKASAYLPSPTTESLQQERDQQLRNHLKAANFLTDLQNHFMAQYEEIDATISSLADRTQSDNLLSQDAPHKRIRDLQDEFAQSLKHDIPDLPSSRLLMLASGVIARWLGDCTLNFPYSPPP